MNVTRVGAGQVAALSFGPNGAKHALGLDGVASRQVLDAIHAGVLVIADSGLIVHANARACEILCRPIHELEGCDISQPFAARDELLARPREERVGWRVITPPTRGVVVGYRITRVNLDRDGSPLWAIVFHDMTAHIAIQEERDRFLQLATMGQIMPTILHELKNPLAAITTTIEVMLEEVPAGETEQQLQAVLGELRRMRLSFDGIGAVGRPVHGVRPAAVDHALREAALVLRGRAEHAGVRFTCSVANMPPLRLEPVVVRAIIFNLVMNAIDACSPGDEIALTARLDDRAALEIRVEDTGRGMTAEERARCTELFFTSKPHGTGIGLALCARAVESAGGEMHIESEPGGGTRVAVRLPLERS